MHASSSSVFHGLIRCAVFSSCLGASAGIAAVPAGPPAVCRAESGQERLTVLELYTSEGCSSCPPADRWLSREFGSAQTAHGAVPLAFHVDYWNQLGWPDRFSRPEFSARQQEIAARQRSAVIYTPQFVLDGRDVRPSSLPAGAGTVWRTDSSVPQAHIRIATGAPSAANIRVEGSVEVADPDLRARAAVRVALTQSALESQVTAGENGGRRLRHDHVVRAWAGPYTADATGRIGFDVRLPRPAEFRLEHANVTVLAEDTRTGRTLQALSVPVCRE